MLVPIESYGAYLATWAKRIEAAGYFADEYDPDTDVAVNGIDLQRHVREALDAWASPVSPTGLDYRG